MITMVLPNLSISLITNSLPILNAITANANSLITENDSISYELINLKNEGPKKRPATKYPDTLGSLKTLATFPPIIPTNITILIFNSKFNLLPPNHNIKPYDSFNAFYKYETLILIIPPL